MDPSLEEPWGPPRPEDRRRLTHVARSGWVLSGFVACLLAGTVVAGAEMGSVRPTGSGMRLPQGASSVTAEPAEKNVATTDALELPETRDMIELLDSNTSAPAPDASDSSIPDSKSVAAPKSATTRASTPMTFGLPSDIDPLAPSTTNGGSTPPSSQVPTATTSAASSSTTNAPSGSPPSPPTTTTVLAPTTTIATTTTVAPFDPAKCSGVIYFLLHWNQCRALLPPPSTTTTIQHPDN